MMSDDYVGPTTKKLEDLIKHPDRSNTHGFNPKRLHLLGIDPGGVTGWSAISIPSTYDGKDIFSHSFETLLDARLRWVHGQVDCYDEDWGSNILCRSLIDKWPEAAVIIEDFYVRIKAADLSPVRITAILEHHMYLRNRRWHKMRQQPSMAKRITDDRLRLMRAYQREGGLNHARDADRHVVMVLRKCFENKGLKERLWPHVYKTD